MSEPTRDPVVEQARAARDSGAAWRARDLLAAHVEAERDPEALSLLGEVLHDMGDLPRAGAIWFAAGAKGPEVDAAVAAWREQAHDDFGVMWRSLPAAVRAEPRPRRLEALRERARAAEAASSGPAADPAALDRGGRGDRGGPGETEVAAGGATASGHDPEPEDDDGFDASWLVAWVLAIAFVVFAVIGFVTALGWIVPG